MIDGETAYHHHVQHKDSEKERCENTASEQQTVDSTPSGKRDLASHHRSNLFQFFGC